MVLSGRLSHFLQALILRIYVIKDVDNIGAEFLNRALQVLAVLVDTKDNILIGFFF